MRFSLKLLAGMAFTVLVFSNSTWAACSVSSFAFWPVGGSNHSLHYPTQGSLSAPLQAQTIKVRVMLYSQVPQPNCTSATLGVRFVSGYGPGTTTPLIQGGAVVNGLKLNTIVSNSGAMTTDPQISGMRRFNINNGQVVELTFNVQREVASFLGGQTRVFSIEVGHLDGNYMTGPLNAVPGTAFADATNCVRAAPSLVSQTWMRPNAVVPGYSSSIRFLLKNNDSAGCGPSVIVPPYQGSAPPGQTPTDIPAMGTSFTSAQLERVTSSTDFTYVNPGSSVYINHTLNVSATTTQLSGPLYFAFRRYVPAPVVGIPDNRVQINSEPAISVNSGTLFVNQNATSSRCRLGSPYLVGTSNITGGNTLTANPGSYVDIPMRLIAGSFGSSCGVMTHNLKMGASSVTGGPVAWTASLQVPAINFFNLPTSATGPYDVNGPAPLTLPGIDATVRVQIPAGTPSGLYYLQPSLFPAENPGFSSGGYSSTVPLASPYVFPAGYGGFRVQVL